MDWLYADVVHADAQRKVTGLVLPLAVMPSLVLAWHTTLWYKLVGFASQS